MITVKGNTYPARNMLKDAGFYYEAALKEWHGDKNNLDELKRISTPSYSRANAKVLSGLTIQEV